MKIGNLDIKNMYLGELPVTSMFLGNLPIPVEGGGDWKFIGLDDNLEEATGSNITCYGVIQYKGSDTEIALPSEYKDLPVVAIYNNVFAEENEITSIYIPSSYKYLGDNAFEEMVHLTFINIPYSVEYIGSYLFDGCINLSSVSLDSGITYLPNGVFSRCSSLASITLPNTIESIGEWCFNSCTSLNNLTIPNSVTSIGEYAFSSCNSLTNITLSNNLDYLETGLFQSCDGLESIIIPDSITSIHNRVFVNCHNLGEINIPVSVTSIGQSAFDAQYSGRKVYYDGTIEDWFGINLTYSNANPLYYWKWQETIIGGKLYLLDNTGNVTYNNKKYSLATNITIPNNVAILSQTYLAYCSSVEKITIPGYVNQLGVNALRYCYNLSTVDIKEGLTSLGNRSDGGYVFSDCPNLTKIVIPESITLIMGYCFQNCSKVRVYYKGDASQWTTLKSTSAIAPAGNTYITSRDPYYYSEEDLGSGYWHYVDGEPTLWS